jgi:putative tricarboxylic transport membrane protein
MANIFMLVLGIFCAGQFAKVVRVPSNFLAATILVLTVVGSFAINNSIVDVYIMLAFGLLGYLLKVLDFDSTPIVLGMILGPIAEKGLLQTIILKKGLLPGVASMFSRPICLVLMALTVLSLLTPVIQSWKAKKS